MVPVSSVSYHLSSFSDVHYFVFGVQHATMEGVFPCSFSLLKRLSHSILKIPSLIPFCRTLLYKFASTDVNDRFKISVFYTDQNHISQGILFTPNFSCYDISWHKLDTLKMRLSSRWVRPEVIIKCISVIYISASRGLPLGNSKKEVIYL